MLPNILLSVLALLNIGLSVFIIQLLKPGKVKRLKNYPPFMNVILDETEEAISK